MVNVTIKMRVPADKRNEVLHTLTDLLVQMRREPDCVNCHVYQDTEAEDEVIFEQEWSTIEALATYLRSGIFKVLLGTMKLLPTEPEIKVNIVTATEGLEVMSAIQGG